MRYSDTDNIVVVEGFIRYVHLPDNIQAYTADTKYQKRVAVEVKIERIIAGSLSHEGDIYRLFLSPADVLSREMGRKVIIVLRGRTVERVYSESNILLDRTFIEE